MFQIGIPGSGCKMQACAEFADTAIAPARKGLGVTGDARALWIQAPRQARLRAENIARDEGTLLVRTLYSGISRGTEALVFHGCVPESEWQRMRAPQQAGDLPFPVKYGYALVGRVEEGPPDRLGEIVFSLHPHQDLCAIPAGMAHPVPQDVPAARAILAANMETALNVIWDAGIAPGDRVAVVGGGLVGLLVAWLAAKIPATDTVLIDINPARAPIAAALGIAFSEPDAAAGDRDVVVHVSASEKGLETALGLAGQEARMVEASWYGAAEPRVPLGRAFHSKRLQIVSSQVGGLPARQRPRWTFARRLETALGLLADARLDNLISGETAFSDLAEDYATVLDQSDTLCHRIRY